MIVLKGILWYQDTGNFKCCLGGGWGGEYALVLGHAFPLRFLSVCELKNFALSLVLVSVFQNPY